MASFSVDDRDTGWAKLMGLAKQDPKHVVVGFVSGKTTARNMKLAIIHEFGTETIPERSHMRSTYDAELPRLTKLAEQYADKILSQKMTIDEALDKMGLYLANRHKAKFRSGPFAPLKTATRKSIDRKQAKARKAKKALGKKGPKMRDRSRDKPLIDTAQMANSPTWQVRSGK